MRAIADLLDTDTVATGEDWTERIDTRPVDPDGFCDCDVCGNRRMVRFDLPLTSEHFGKLFPCPACGEAVARTRRQVAFQRFTERIDEYGVKPLPECSFETFVLAGRSVSVRTAHDEALRIARVLKPGWLLLTGPAGTGKTHLAMAVANYCREAPDPRTVMLVTAPGLLDLLRSGYDRGDYDELLQLTKSVDILAIDDLGMQSDTEWAQERMFEIINDRYNRRAALMVTTNASPEMIDPRIRSRFNDRELCRVVKVADSDYRPKKARA